MGTACSCAFKISFLKNAQPSWIPLPFRTASQGTLSIRLLNRPKSALPKSKVAVLLTPLLTSLRIENSYHFMITMSKTAPNHHITHKSFSVHKQQVQQAPSLVGSLTSCVRKSSSTHSKNLLDCFLSAVLYFQQTSEQNSLGNSKSEEILLKSRRFKAALNPFIPQSVLMPGVAPTQLQDLVLGLVELHEVCMGLFLKPRINRTTQLGVICKLGEGALDPTVCVIDEIPVGILERHLS
ncbi:hypothetical protein QYF61_027913 [Mycteria americana]|uniref:Uncharacterized protein n=1 Tax=Mycteria americana TaxID=33587 RepID=A0AAN7RU09_MYCAM|nr:hypothetical protein QYF61_027913 [Mycteria americana]